MSKIKDLVINERNELQSGHINDRPYVRKPIPWESPSWATNEDAFLEMLMRE